jgi:hypothetical protein
MPQLNQLVLKDAAATPVDHTFKPRGIDSGVATLVESTGVPIGESRISFAQNRNSNGRIRATIKVSVPVVQDAVVGGVTRPTVVRTNYADLVFNFDASSSTQDRADIVKYVNGLLAGAQTMVQGYLVDLEGLY